VLPESPQHRRWSQARSRAEQEIVRLRQDVNDGLDEGAKLLDLNPPIHSDAWFALAEHLRQIMSYLGSATHIINEWAEPDDMHPDIDDSHDPGDEDRPVRELVMRRRLRIGRRVLPLSRLYPSSDLYRAILQSNAPRKRSPQART
jgi:hypothetical protein